MSHGRFVVLDPNPTSQESTRPASPGLASRGAATSPTAACRRGEIPLDVPYLVFSRGPQAGTAFPMSGHCTTIGRGRDCDIVLDDSTVSRCHARIWNEGDGYVLLDSGSLNGTFRNREPIDRVELSHGDEIWIGTFRFTFHTHR